MQVSEVRLPESKIEGYDCTRQQLQIWTLQSAAGVPYRVRATARLSGTVTAGALEAALQQAVAEHEALRTRFHLAHGMTAPLQSIDGDGMAAVEIVDWAGQEAPPFADGPADVNRADVHARIVRFSSTEHLLQLSVSALCADEESLVELIAAVARVAAGDAVREVGTSALQYPDYAAWRGALMTSEEHAPLRTFWDDTRGGVAGDLLPYGGGPSDAPVRQTAVLEHTLDTAALRGIESFAVAHGISPEAVFLTAWTILLCRSRGIGHVTVNCHFDGRTHARLRDAIGRFAHDLPLQLHAPADRPVAMVLADAMRCLGDAAAHEDYAGLQPVSGIGPSKTTTPLVGFRWMERAKDRQAGGLRVRFEACDEDDTAHPLSLHVRRGEQSCLVSLRYDPTCYADPVPQWMRSGLLLTLGALVERSDATVAQIGTMSDEERQALLVTFNRTGGVTVSDSVDRMFTRQAARAPDRVAVSCGDERLTYAELDRASNRLAHVLRGLSVAPGSKVPILLRRGPDMLVAILAVMKVGGAYVPLDPVYPRYRIATMLAASAPALTIASEDLRELLPAGFPTLCVDREAATIAASSDAAVETLHDLTGLAYVIFTSGSTGRPKGVMVTHLSLANYLAWAAEAYDLTAGCGALLHTSISFDLTVTSLLAPLLVGQQVIMLTEAPGVAALASALSEEKEYSLVKLTPSHLSALRALISPAALRGRVRVLVVGGEALSGTLAAEFAEQAPEMRIVNEYGPTEITVASCFYTYRPEDAKRNVPIGRPIANARHYILDERFEPVPFGAVGELHIGGAGVAAGYLAEPQLTAERFRENPFDTGMIYRSGDLVRYLPGGMLDFIGRADEELKIAGVRIHPSEIETVLQDYPGISECVVVGIGGQSGTRQLVAYYIVEGQVIPPTVLRAFMLDHLPEHMIPSRFIAVNAIPRTPNGKRDIGALPKPEPALAAGRAPYVAPRYFEEDVLAAVWVHAFGLERVGIDDNYFVLGGDSLRSVQITALAQRRGVGVSVAQVHRHPTIRALAEVAHRGDPWLEPLPALEPFAMVTAADRQRLGNDIEDAYPLNLLQEGMIYHRDFAPKSAVYHAITSYKIRIPFSLAAMDQVIRQLVRRHPLLRTSFNLVDYSQPLQLVHHEFKDLFTFEDFRGKPAAEQSTLREAWVEQEKIRSFDVNEYPLIRFAVHLLTDDIFELSLSYHHEIIDGWSDAYMITEILHHYLSIINGRPFDPPAPTTSFRDAVALEQQALRSETMRDFWLKDLDGAQLMKLPRLLAAPKADKGIRRIVKFDLPIDDALSDGVKQLAVRLAVPVKSVLLAAHLRVMSMFGGGNDVMTYTVSNGRPENRDGHAVVGLFVNSLAFRMRLRGDSWADLIRATLDREHELLPYRRYPMAELKRQSGNEPLSETLFFFNHYHMADVLDQWEGAELLGVEIFVESTFPFVVNTHLRPVSKRLGILIEYDALQYSEQLMAAIRDSYLTVLNAMVGDPTSRYDAVCTTPDWVHRSVVEEWNSTATDFPPFRPVHRLFETIAAAQPDRIALTQEQCRISYGALNRRANRLARLLRQRGVSVGTPVVLCFDRTLGMLVAMLAVMKAGGAYVPIDASYPAERIGLIMEGIADPFVLTDASLARLFHGTAAAMMLTDIDDESPTLQAHDLSGPELTEAPAYIIHTSGTSGRPKGVVVTHGGLTNSTCARLDYYRAPIGNFLLLSSYAFDSSVAGIFWTLCSGGNLVLPDEAALSDLDLLADTIRRQEITHTLMIPSLYAALLEHADGPNLTATNTVVVAGEACPLRLYAHHVRRFPEGRLFNEYGPTEATVWSTVFEGETRALGTLLPIGRPLANTQAYVVDPFLQPSPIGVCGEIMLGGRNIAQGYMRAPAATAECFVPDPFSGLPGARLYRTGDLGRWLPDGQLDFLDRMDTQVKVNGFRIEPREIEVVMESHPAVRRCVVQVQRDVSGIAKGLAAYIVPQAEGVDEAVLRAYARDRLPKYTLPAAYVVLDAFPMTPSGKIDRKALPAPAADTVARSSERMPSRTPTEELIANIWRECLNVPQVGVNENFFDLGGESLRAMRIMSRVRSAFQVQVPLSLMMDEPTVANLARLVEAARWAKEDVAADSDAAFDGRLVATL